MEEEVRPGEFGVKVERGAHRLQLKSYVSLTSCLNSFASAG